MLGGVMEPQSTIPPTLGQGIALERLPTVAPVRGSCLHCLEAAALPKVVVKGGNRRDNWLLPQLSNDGGSIGKNELRFVSNLSRSEMGLRVVQQAGAAVVSSSQAPIFRLDEGLCSMGSIAGQTVETLNPFPGLMASGA